MRTLILGVLGALVVLGTPSAGATLIRAFPLEALTIGAHDVVRGHVLESESVYDPVFRRVYTHTQVRVVETLAGQARVGEVLVLRQIGGILDGIESRVVGTAHLELGAEVVLFARSDSAHHYLVGMAQGVYVVDRRSPGPSRLHRGTGALRWAPTLGPAAPLAPDRLTLEALRTRVHALRSREVGP